MDTNSEIIILTPLQRAQKKYYEKRKSSQIYKDQVKVSNKKYPQRLGVPWMAYYFGSASEGSSGNFHSPEIAFLSQLPGKKHGIVFP
jgi:hypothetical protein